METWLRKARIAATPRSWILKRVLSNGAAVYGKNRAGHGIRGVYLEGDRIEPELEHLENFLPKDAVFMDVGANTGAFSLKAAKFLDGGSGFVISIEPNVEMATMLAYSAQENGFNNLRLRSLCIGERTGEHKLWLNYDKPNAFSLMKRAEDALSASVLVVTLDELCTWEGLTRLDYVKIDVVGAEHGVIAGASRTIRQFGPMIQVAVAAGYVPIELSDYSIFHFEHAPQDNVVYVRNDDPRTKRVRELGYKKL
jgi:FkbM family methyltransferase